MDEITGLRSIPLERPCINPGREAEEKMKLNMVASIIVLKGPMTLCKCDFKWQEVMGGVLICLHSTNEFWRMGIEESLVLQLGLLSKIMSFPLPYFVITVFAWPRISETVSDVQ